MTDHADLSRRLALAIGYAPEDVRAGLLGSADACLVRCVWWWREFDYRDPLVIWPIAERYNCFPVRGYMQLTGWGCQVTINGYRTDCAAFDTAAKAVARAVIAGAGVPRVEPNVGVERTAKASPTDKK